MTLKKLMRQVIIEANNEGKQIADTIAQQMGGYSRLKIMIGATNFSYDKNGTLSFKIKASKRYKYLKVIYDKGRDLYDMEFYSNSKLLKRIEGVYADQLIEIFERTTGLSLRF